ncbi:MAG: putative hydroxymethylpyrimidine transporter CytX [Desulfovibrio sp.]|jgi:putative hydroxymethylpyrimidine transporter CytX|nr:putative hydroxymethylpyrimidine transporter CytX [Desulfovibrio sp.]
MSKQQLSFANLFFLWFGAAVSVAEILTGGLLAELGLERAMWANVLGHMAGTALLVLAGWIGFRERLPAIMSTRISFGRQGSYLISVINVLQLLGWTAWMVLLGGGALNGLTTALWGLDNQPLLSATVGAFIGLWVFLGIRGFKWLNMIAVSLLFVLTVVLSWVLLSRPEALADAGGGAPFHFGFEMAIIMPLSWFPLISDYTSMARSRTSAWLAPLLGYFFGSCWMYGIGILGALHSGSFDPASMMLAANLGLIALGIIGLSTITTTFLDVYSAAVSSLNIFSGLSRRWTSVVFAVAGTVLAMYVPITEYEWFLYTLGSVFAPLVAILLADYYILRADRRATSWDPAATISLALGVTLYYQLKPFGLLVGPTLVTILSTFVLHLGVRSCSRILGKC